MRSVRHLIPNDDQFDSVVHSAMPRNVQQPILWLMQDIYNSVDEQVTNPIHHELWDRFVE